MIASCTLFDSLGLTIHPKKSYVEPEQKITYMYLGFELDWVKVTVALTTEKRQTISGLPQKLVAKDEVTIRESASLICNLVTADPAIPGEPFVL